MKFYSLLIVTLIVGALAFGGLWHRSSSAVSSDGPVSQQIDRARKALFKSTPDSTLDIVAATNLPGSSELLDPAVALPHFHKFMASEARELNAYASSCQPPIPQIFEDRELAKALTWAEYECGELKTLPTRFFETPPFMHPGGHSFVAMALKSQRMVANAKLFASEHVSGMHVTELNQLPDGIIDGDATRRLLGSLTHTTVAALLAHEPTVRDGDKIYLYAAESEARPGGGIYKVFPMTAWEALNVPWNIVLKQSQSACQLVSGAFCWVSVPLGNEIFYQTGTLVMLAALCLVLAVLALTRVRAQRRDRNDQLFVLRTLTHELRTPATGLGLTLETLRTDFDHLPDTSQSAFLQLCNDNQRLSRVIAASARYLKVHGSPSRFETTELPSLRGYLEAVLEPFEGRITLTLPSTDRSFRADPYWLKVCICNLIDNALDHGLAPVTVDCDLNGKMLSIRVTDAGTLPRRNLESLAREASRREGRGLGLGLGIVMRTVKDLGNSLTMSASPTTFLLTWKESP